MGSGREWANGSVDFENILPRFQIQSEIITDLQILQLQRIADSSFFGARIMEFACNRNKNFNGGFG